MYHISRINLRCHSEKEAKKRKRAGPTADSSIPAKRSKTSHNKDSAMEVDLVEDEGGSDSDESDLSSEESSLSSADDGGIKVKDEEPASPILLNFLLPDGQLDTDEARLEALDANITRCNAETKRVKKSRKSIKCSLSQTNESISELKVTLLKLQKEKDTLCSRKRSEVCHHSSK